MEKHIVISKAEFFKKEGNASHLVYVHQKFIANLFIFK